MVEQTNYLDTFGNFSNGSSTSNLSSQLIIDAFKNEHKKKFNEWIQSLNIFTTVILYSEMALCFTLNFISFSCIIYRRQLTAINLLVLNLGIADMLYACGIPFYVRQFSNSKVLTHTILGCRLSFLLDVSCMIVSDIFFSNYRINH